MTAEIEEIQQGVYLLKGEGKGSHHYLIRAAYRNVLIDSGLDQDFLCLQEQLLSLGLKVRDIDLVINTHEHLDHIGANRYFQETSFIAAHRFAATKITLEDHYVTLYRSGDRNEVPLRVHLWLENRSLFDLGSHTLEVSTRRDIPQAPYVFTSSRQRSFSPETRCLPEAHFLTLLNPEVWEITLIPSHV